MLQLDDQGEQLENMEEGLTRINNEMGTAEKGLAEMSKCCGIIMCPWNKSDDGDIKVNRLLYYIRKNPNRQFLIRNTAAMYETNQKT